MTARIYGKLVGGPEFVGRLSGQEPEITFGDWLDRANSFAYVEGAKEWQGAYYQGAAHAFLVHPVNKLKRSVIGALVPSQDNQGRPFPLMGVMTVRDDAFGAGFAFLPVAYESFFARIGTAVYNARAAKSLGQIESLLSSIDPPRRGAVEAAAKDFADWGERPALVPKLWRALFPQGRAEAAVRVLGALARHVRGEGRRYVRLPLGDGAGAAAAFWLRVLVSLGGSEERIRVAFWSLAAGGVLLVALDGEPPDVELPIDFWLKLWLPTARDSKMLDACGVLPDDAASTSPLSPHLIRVARAGDARISDLFKSLV